MGRIMMVKQVCELSSGGVLVLLGFLGDLELYVLFDGG